MNDFHFIPTIDTAQENRALTRRYLPNSATAGGLSLIYQTSITMLAFSLANNTEANFYNKVTLETKEVFLGILDTTILSDGTPILASATNFILFGPMVTPYDGTTGVLAEDYEHMTRFGLLNVSGGTRNITVYTALRYVINLGGTVE